jgi:hypothetical protein
VHCKQILYWYSLKQSWAIAIAITLYTLSVNNCQIEKNVKNKHKNVNLKWKQFKQIIIESFYDLLVKISGIERAWDYN